MRLTDKNPGKVMGLDRHPGQPRSGRRRQDSWQPGPLPGPAALWRSLPPAWKG